MIFSIPNPAKPLFHLLLQLGCCLFLGQSSMLAQDTLALVSDVLRLEVDPQTGGRISSLQYQGIELLATRRDEKNLQWGSTVWPAPQSGWHWPPPAAIDQAPYKVRTANSTTIEVESQPGAYRGLQLIKRFELPDSQTIAITYTFTNQGDSTVKTAIWENTRVDLRGEVRWPAGEQLLPNSPGLWQGGSISTLKLGVQDKKQKLFLDTGGAWLAYEKEGVVLTKTFPSLEKEEVAPGQAPVEVYVDPVDGFAELEVQGPYVVLAPGESTSFELEWRVEQATSPTLVWLRPEGGQRNEYAFFRREIELPQEPESALLHLYADSRYALYVNEQYLGFGPARSYHAHPYYDTYDLAPFLREGNNVIAVQVLSNGMETYQLFDYKGGFTAWGTIGTGQEAISLNITKGWLCRKSTGYDQAAPRFSFATGPIENWDAREEGDWNALRTKTTGWGPPVPLADQESWGEFRPRPIPHLTQQEVAPIRLRGAYPLADKETLYSFRIPTPDRNQPEYNSSLTALAYTYIYSPAGQQVDVGLWWGDYFLNGQEIRKKEVQNREHYRRDYPLDLKKGWNEFVVRYGIIWGSWDFYMAVPKGRGVELSASREKGSEGIFYTYGPFGKTGNAEIQAIDLTQGIAGIRVETDRSWVLQNRVQGANQPARDLAWYDLDTDKPLGLQPGPHGEWLIPKHDKGIALFFDMNETQLGRFFIEGDFPEGTQIDIGFSEELDSLGFPWLYKRYQIGAGLRFIADGERKRYESFKPYGARYLHVNISKHDRPVKLSQAGMIRQVYPFQATGSFRCSDPLLNRIWEAGWRTLQLCAEDSYTDTPFRERGLYAGDMLPEAAITMAVSGDLRLVAHSLRVFQDMYREEMREGLENRHNDFPLITLITMHWYSQYTQDWSLAEAYYDNYASLLRHHISKKGGRGLIPAGKVFIEWSDINKEDAAMAAYQGLLVEGMQVLSQWAERFGAKEDRAFFEQQASGLTKAANHLLWDEQAGAYFDGLQADTVITDKHLTSSIWPSLYGLADTEQLQAVLDFLATELTDIGEETRRRKITPYSSFYLFALLYQEGEAALAEYFMKKHWGPMALHSATPTVWENFDIEGGQGTSSHAWSGHPTFFMATEVLGVNLGFNKPFDPAVVEIMPQSATLSWAEGTVAHPAGPVRVRWEVRGRQLWLEYEVPEGVEVLVSPRGRLGELELVLGEP